MAAFMSIVLPGWGHFYLGRRRLAVCEILIALVLLGAAITQLFGVFLDVIHERATVAAIIEVALPWVLVLAACSVADGLFTLVFSFRRIVPE